MKKYLVVKVIEAEPQTSTENNKETGHFTPNELEGYKLVHDGGKYQSWCPKDLFEKSYRPIDNLTFGLAVEALKMGKKVGRVGWNGKGMWLKLIKEYSANINQKSDNVNIDGFLPWIGMKTADNKFVPWLASQTDVLAEDWVIIQEIV